MTPYPAYKPSGIDWLGDIPSSWKVKKLKYVTRPMIDGAHILTYVESGVPFLQVIDIQKKA